mmetsp:Transcript_81756/g.213294  ORF Transcript_81756/g.213294 Transcript_81756/m.213294 type:complete len:235 (-) Transcript_81756:332-1036(-)
MQEAWNSSDVTCSDSHSGRKGMMLHRRSTSTSIIFMKSLKLFSSTWANSTTCLPSSDSRKWPTQQNWTSATNSAWSMLPSMLTSNHLRNFLQCFSSTATSFAEVRLTTTGARSFASRVPVPFVSKRLNSSWQLAMNSGLSREFFKSVGRRLTTSGKLSRVRCTICSNVSTLERPRLFLRVLGESEAPAVSAFFAASFLARANRSSTYEYGSSGLAVSSPCRMSWNIFTKLCSSR